MENNNRMENNFSCRLDLMAIKQSYNNLMQSSREGLKIFHVSVYFVEIKEIRYLAIYSLQKTCVNGF